ASDIEMVPYHRISRGDFLAFVIVPGNAFEIYDGYTDLRHLHRCHPWRFVRPVCHLDWLYDPESWLGNEMGNLSPARIRHSIRLLYFRYAIAENRIRI
ncbi:hypothetical protein, partial [Terribacillus sp. AE2B 122]